MRYSITEDMRAMMDRVTQLTESLQAIPESLYEAVDNLEVDSRGTLEEGDYALCYDTLADDLSEALTNWRQVYEGELLDSGDNWAIFKKA